MNRGARRHLVTVTVPARPCAWCLVDAIAVWAIVCLVLLGPTLLLLGALS